MGYKHRIISEAERRINARRANSAWSRGVNAYAIDLLGDLNEAIEYAVKYDSIPEAEVSNLLKDRRRVEHWLLNGARDWKRYSYGGSALIANCDIARRLCTPSELRRTRDGARRPNKDEDWYDLQACALYQAARLVLDAITEAAGKTYTVNIA